MIPASIFPPQHRDPTIASAGDAAFAQGEYLLKQAGHQPDHGSAHLLSWNAPLACTTSWIATIHCRKCGSQVKMELLREGGVKFLKMCSETCP